MYYLAILIIFLSLGASGCQKPMIYFKSQESLEEEVLSKDPGFAYTIKKKSDLDKQINDLKSGFSQKRKKVKDYINRLKQELSAERSQLDNRLKEIYAELAPERDALIKENKNLTKELKLRKSSLFVTNKMVDKFNKLLDHALGPDNLSEEIEKWRKKIASLKTQAEELSGEISVLRERIELNRLKLKFLK